MNPVLVNSIRSIERFQVRFCPLFILVMALSLFFYFSFEPQKYSWVMLFLCFLTFLVDFGVWLYGYMGLRPVSKQDLDDLPFMLSISSNEHLSLLGFEIPFGVMAVAPDSCRVYYSLAKFPLPIRKKISAFICANTQDNGNVSMSLRELRRLIESIIPGLIFCLSRRCLENGPARGCVRATRQDWVGALGSDVFAQANNLHTHQSLSAALASTDGVSSPRARL